MLIQTFSNCDFAQDIMESQFEEDGCVARNFAQLLLVKIFVINWEVVIGSYKINLNLFICNFTYTSPC